MTERPVFIDHVAIRVRDLERSRAFYRAALAPFGSHEIQTGDEVAFGPKGAEDLVLSAAGPPHAPLHIALAASSRGQVVAFHAAALAAGGEDNGSPGLRPEYHAGYYAAYVLDPDGHNVEAVFHDRSADASSQRA